MLIALLDVGLRALLEKKSHHRVSVTTAVERQGKAQFQNQFALLYMFPQEIKKRKKMRFRVNRVFLFIFAHLCVFFRKYLFSNVETKSSLTMHFSEAFFCSWVAGDFTAPINGKTTKKATYLTTRRNE